MPCLEPDGSLPRIGVLILRVTRKPTTDQEVAEASGLPLFRARSGIRGLIKAGLIEKQGESFVTTSEGVKKLEAQGG
jgi:predicted transcriptional regulator